MSKWNVLLTLAIIVFLWIVIWTPLMGVPDIIYEATQNITYAANTTSGNITPLEDAFIGGWWSTILLLLPIGLAIGFGIHIFRGGNV